MDWEEGSVYFTQANIGKYKIVEKAPAYGYTQATQNGSTPWMVEFAIDCQDKVVEYLGENADCNKPWGNKVIIHKTDSETGNAIAANALFSLYEWNAARGMYEISPNYAIVRDADGSYTVQCLQNWPLAEYGSLYVEDTLCDTREDTANHDGTTSSHSIYYTDYDMSSYPNSRAHTNYGQFLVVEHTAPQGYYGDWTDITNPGNASSDLGKRAYYLRLTGDGSTITLGNADYNADIATANNGGVLVETADGVVTVNVSPDTKSANKTYPNGYTMKADSDTLQNDRTMGEIVLIKVDLGAMRYLADGSAHADAVLDGAVYDLYAAEDIHHPDGVTGLVDYDPYRAELLNGTDLLKYKSSIIVALQEMNEPHAGWSGDLMSDYNKGDGLAQKVTSLKISIEIHEGALCGCATVTLTEDMKPGEMQALMDYITTQYSKGYGKIFAEQAIDVDDGRLFVYLWQQKDFTLTVELERRTTRELAKSLPRPKMKLSGGKGNIFSIVREADTLLSCYGYLKQTDEMYARIDKAETYREVLDIISEYVETELSVPPRPHTPKKGGDAR